MDDVGVHAAAFIYGLFLPLWLCAFKISVAARGSGGRSPPDGVWGAEPRKHRHAILVSAFREHSSPRRVPSDSAFA
jgi:hypothetical protein